jgi:hypothetical protein
MKQLYVLIYWYFVWRSGPHRPLWERWLLETLETVPDEERTLATDFRMCRHVLNLIINGTPAPDHLKHLDTRIDPEFPTDRDWRQILDDHNRDMDDDYCPECGKEFCDADCEYFQHGGPR